MNVLSFGNSFSEDAHARLHRVANADSAELTCANLHIGGCSLHRHADNIAWNVADYTYDVNGVTVACNVPASQYIDAMPWDAVTVQQVSQRAGLWETYQPYLDQLVGYIRQHTDAPLYFQETWAYETDSDHRGFAHYDRDQRKMYAAVHETAAKAAAHIGATVIPTGTVIQTLREQVAGFDYVLTGRSLNRDGFHLSLDYGRYAAALTWYATLTGRRVTGITCWPLGDNIQPGLVTDVQRTVDAVCFGK